MNAILRRHYPIESLPADLRQGLPDRGWVEIEIRQEEPRERRKLADLVGTGQNVHGTEQEVIDYIRALREEG